MLQLTIIAPHNLATFPFLCHALDLGRQLGDFRLGKLCKIIVLSIANPWSS